MLFPRLRLAAAAAAAASGELQRLPSISAVASRRRTSRGFQRPEGGLQQHKVEESAGVKLRQGVGGSGGLRKATEGGRQEGGCGCVGAQCVSASGAAEKLWLLASI